MNNMIKKQSKHKGMVLLTKPLKLKLGGWSPMNFDAKIERRGITWYRVKDGMGGRGDREDWVAGIDYFCLSIHDYNWTKESIGLNYGSFENAILQQSKLTLAFARGRIDELESQIVAAKKAEKMIEAATKRG